MMRNSQPQTEEQMVRIPASVLYSWLLRFYAVVMLIVVWAGHFFLQRTWPAPIKLWLCTALGIAAILHSIFSRRPGLRPVAPPGVKGFIPRVHALGVIIVVLAVAVFFIWVAFGPPH